MPGRHQAASRRRVRLRWLVGIAGGALIGAMLLAFGSAGATPTPVTATFSVLGVTSSNCPNLDVGGASIYVEPGQELDANTSLLGINLLGLNASLLDLKGTLVIDGKSYSLSKSKTVVDSLSKGDHSWTFTATSLAGLPLLVSLSSVLEAGAKLTWNGTIHVTDNAAQCGVEVQVPSVSASVSATGLPPVQVGVPGVKVSAPLTIPTSLPALPIGGKTTAGAGTHTSTTQNINNPIPVPARVVPGGDVAAGGGGGYNAGSLPDAGSSGQGSGSLVGASGGSPTANAAPDQNSTGKHKTIDLAASPSSSTGEVWVVLAIVAVIALAFVAATYARLYLLKRND